MLKQKYAYVMKQYFRDIKGPFSIAIPYILKYKYYHFLIFLFMIVDIGLTLLYAWFLGAITDTAVRGDIGGIKKLIVFGVVLTIFMIVFNYCSAMVSAKMNNSILKEFKEQVFHHMLRLPVKLVDRKHSGELLAHIQNDANGILGIVGRGIIDFIYLPIMFLAAFIYVWQINWKIAVFIISVSPIVLAISVIFGFLLRKNNELYLKYYAQVNKILSETFSGWFVIRAFTLEKLFFNKFHDKNEDIYELALQNTKLSQYFSIASQIAYSFSSLLIMGLGAYFVSKSIITVGSLMVFAKLMNYLISPLSDLAKKWVSFQNSLASVERVQQILNEPVEMNELAGFQPNSLAAQSLELKNVSFSYDEGKDLFHHVNLSIPIGKVTALVGTSGAGKSSLIKLLIGFYHPNEGEILLNNESTKHISPQLLRSYFAYVPQDSFAFAGTISENLKMIKPNATEEEIISATTNANIHDFIQSLPHGYDTEIGERGVKLSGGQKQRLAIARAILKNAPILLLDEATSSLDSETEFAVQQALNKLMVGRTTIIIAHRLSTIQSADQIVVMNEGKIVEIGTHDELLTKQNAYYKLYKKQVNTASSYAI